MKTIKLFVLLFVISLSSCSSVHVNADYDSKISFTNYKTYAYLKSGIDKAEISDLDKKRILNAIDEKLLSKGMIKSENPDLLIRIFTKEKDQVNVSQNFGWGWGWGWNPYWGMGYSNVTTTPIGTLFIDILDAKTKELIWQGEGSGYLTKNTAKKEARIKEIVSKILEQYPPNALK